MASLHGNQLREQQSDSLNYNQLAETMSEDPMGQYTDRIAEFLSGKTVLITGGTGFVGKVLMEKILRVCPGIEKIYLFIRPKKNKSVKERLADILNGPLFDLLREKQGDKPFSKVEAINAVIDAPNLSLAPEDRQMVTQQVQIIYHCCASVRFDLPLKDAVLLNVRGTKLMLELAKESPKLILFAHVSTAYCHVQEKELKEQTYDPPCDPHKVIDICEWMSEESLRTLEPKILGEIPNTYSFTKALSEGLVNEQMESLPVMILRPSIVIPIWKEPIPGWTDNINGPTGLLIGAGKGVLRTMYCDSKRNVDFIPVDILANGILTTTLYFCIINGAQRVYNITSSSEVHLSFQELIDIGLEVVENHIPLNWVLWYPGGGLNSSKAVHLLYYYLFQILPAILIDGILMLLGIEPILMRVQRRIAKGYKVFDYYINRQWNFNNDKSRAIRDTFLNPLEKKIYKLDAAGMDYEDFFTVSTHAARLYILHETDDTIPMAKRHMKLMWFVDKFCKCLIVFGFFYFLWKNLFLPILEA